MEILKALAIVRSLANGVDPDSGQVFPSGSTMQRSEVVRAMYKAAEALERVERMDRKKVARPKKQGEPWSEEDDRKLITLFDAGKALHELTPVFERTIGSIRARLLKYGRINA